MKKNKLVQYGLLLSCLFVLGCSTEETVTEETRLEVTEELLLTTLNAVELEVLENCDESLGNNEGANCCVVFPDSVIVNERYAGGSRYVLNDGSGPTYEPQGLTYEWQITGEGIKISDAKEQYVILEFDSNFKGGLVKAIIYAPDGSERCVGRDSVFLKQ